MNRGDWGRVLKINAFVDGSDVEAVVVDGTDNISRVVRGVEVDEAPHFHVLIDINNDMLRCGIDPPSWIGDLSSNKPDVRADNNLCLGAGWGWELVRNDV